MGIFIEKSRGERTGDASTILFPSYSQSVQKQELIQKAKNLKTGDFVSWNSSGGTARGKIVRIVRDGKIMFQIHLSQSMAQRMTQQF